MWPKVPCDLIIFTVEVCVIIMTAGTILYTCCVLHNESNLPCTIIDHHHQSNHSNNSSDSRLADKTHSEKDLLATNVQHHGIKTISWQKLMQKMLSEKNSKFDASWVIAVLYAGVPVIACMAVLLVIFCVISLYEVIRGKSRKVDEEKEFLV